MDSLQKLTEKKVEQVEKEHHKLTQAADEVISRMWALRESAADTTQEAREQAAAGAKGADPARAAAIAAQLDAEIIEENLYQALADLANDYTLQLERLNAASAARLEFTAAVRSELTAAEAQCREVDPGQAELLNSWRGRRDDLGAELKKLEAEELDQSKTKAELQRLADSRSFEKAVELSTFRELLAAPTGTLNSHLAAVLVLFHKQLTAGLDAISDDDIARWESPQVEVVYRHAQDSLLAEYQPHFSAVVSTENDHGDHEFTSEAGVLTTGSPRNWIVLCQLGEDNSPWSQPDQARRDQISRELTARARKQ